jgi:hypothetical protein
MIATAHARFCAITRASRVIASGRLDAVSAMKVRDMIKIIEQDGWQFVPRVGATVSFAIP